MEDTQRLLRFIREWFMLTDVRLQGLWSIRHLISMPTKSSLTRWWGEGQERQAGTRSSTCWRRERDRFASLQPFRVPKGLPLFSESGFRRMVCWDWRVGRYRWYLSRRRGRDGDSQAGWGWREGGA
ncbi:hypothetical protein LIA77_10128 [Sarocladium implicatum]|nr:hypothetical protein LIA77_10128 [Sarocladium implicatum]